MELNFTILVTALIIISLFIIVDKQILNRFNYFRKNEQYENYLQALSKKPIDLKIVLDNFNKELSTKKVSKIEKHSSFGKGNFTGNIRQEVLPTINEVLNNINSIGNIRLKFVDLDRIEKLQENNNTQYLVGFFVHTVNTSISSKLIINFFRDSKNNIHVSSLKKESDTMNNVPNLTDNLITYTHIPKENGLKQFMRKGILDDEQTNDTSYGAPFGSVGNNINKKGEINRKFVHEPCNYNLHIWDSSGVNKRLKLRDRCRMTNNSQKLAPVSLYANPTVFSPILNEPKDYAI
jgi:hypothetical protein